MNVKVRHALVHRPDNCAALARLLSGIQGGLQGHDEPEYDRQHQRAPRTLCVMEDTLLIALRGKNTHAQSPSMSVAIEHHIHLPLWHHTCSNLPKLNTVVPWIGGHCFTRFQYPIADFQ